MSQVLITESNLSNIADAIREKRNSTTLYSVEEMANAIKGIVGEGVTLQEKIVTPTTSKQVITADVSYNGLSKVTVDAVTSAIDSDIKASNIKKGVDILGITGTLEEGITPSGALNITSNGTHNVTNYATANVNVPTAEDLSTELTEQDALLTTQETTLTDIMNALQGKTAGGASNLIAAVVAEDFSVLAMVDASFFSDLPEPVEGEAKVYPYGQFTFYILNEPIVNLTYNAYIYVVSMGGYKMIMGITSPDVNSEEVCGLQIQRYSDYAHLDVLSDVVGIFGEVSPDIFSQYTADSIVFVWRR